MDNNLYNLMLQLTQEQKSIWRVKKYISAMREIARSAKNSGQDFYNKKKTMSRK